MSNTSKPKKKVGADEWCDLKINLFVGCKHACKYCYAYCMRSHYQPNQYQSLKDWETMIFRPKEFAKKITIKNVISMHHTTHDIFRDPEIFNPCRDKILESLNNNNKVLITTKPHFDVVRDLCSVLNDQREKVLFRFTIGSNDNDLLKFWEPNAPTFDERLKCLQYAFENNFKTSVSMEPFLSDPFSTIDEMMPYISNTLWIGTMNYIRDSNITPDDIKYYSDIRAIISKKNINNIYSKLNALPMIRFKDRFRQKLPLEVQTMLDPIYQHLTFETI